MSRPSVQRLQRRWQGGGGDGRTAPDAAAASTPAADGSSSAPDSPTATTTATTVVTTPGSRPPLGHRARFAGGTRRIRPVREGALERGGGGASFLQMPANRTPVQRGPPQAGAAEGGTRNDAVSGSPPSPRPRLGGGCGGVPAPTPPRPPPRVGGWGTHPRPFPPPSPPFPLLGVAHAADGCGGGGRDGQRPGSPAAVRRGCLFFFFFGVLWRWRPERPRLAACLCGQGLPPEFFRSVWGGWGADVGAVCPWGVASRFLTGFFFCFFFCLAHARHGLLPQA